MGRFESLFGGAREGALDLFGLRNEMDELREHSADAKMLARRVEDLGHQLLNASGSQHPREPTLQKRRVTVERAYNYYYSDPVLGQAVDLMTWYTFGRGVTEPKYGKESTWQEKDGADPEQEIGQKYISAFWADEDNQQVLTTHVAQEQKSTELQLQGNIFLLLFSADRRAGDASLGIPTEFPSVSPVKMTDLPESEVVDVISHPNNRKIPVYYKREYTEQIHDFRTGTYEPGEKRTLYYRDWKHEAPTTVMKRQGGELVEVPWGPDPAEIAEGFIYHIRVNAVSDAKFGQPEVARVLDWSKGLNQYMTDRMAVVQAIAKIAMQVRTRGGQKQVSQVAQQLADISNLGTEVEGSTRRERADQDRTRLALMNQNTELMPMVSDTGAGSAATDIQTIKGQISAGTGIPPHYLGDVGSANLATATAMELPVLKMMEARQELWESVYRDIIGWMLEGVGLDKTKLEVALPPILARDVNATVSSIATMIAAVDPQVQNKELHRWAFAELLDAMGKANTEDILARVFPVGYEPPKPPNEVAMQMQADGEAAAATAAAAGMPSGTPEGQQAAVAAQAAQARAAQVTAAAAGRNGTDRAPSNRLGTASSQRASQARQDRTAGRVGQRQTLTREQMYEEMRFDEGESAFVEAPSTYDEEALAQLPSEVQPATRSALDAIDQLGDELLRELDLGD